MSAQRDLTQSVAVITGAGSGIGQALALALANRGASLSLSDINAEGLENTAQLLPESANVRTDLLDVSNKEAVFKYADTIQEHFGKVNMVFNNAGAALSASVKNSSIEDIEWQMGVNFWGVIYGTKAFLPHLESAEWGHVINVSSLFGLLAHPNNAAYNASKFGVRGFTETLRIELDEEGSSVSASCVHPGGVKTNIARTARTGGANTFPGGVSREEAAANFDKLARTTSEQAANTIIQGMLKNRKRILVGTDAKILDKLQRITPSHYFEVFKRIS